MVVVETVGSVVAAASVALVPEDGCGGVADAFNGRNTGTPISTVNGAFLLADAVDDDADPFIDVVAFVTALLLEAECCCCCFLRAAARCSYTSKNHGGHIKFIDIGTFNAHSLGICIHVCRNIVAESNKNFGRGEL